MTSGQAFLIARSSTPTGLADWVRLRRGGVVVDRVASLPQFALPLAIAPDGDRIVYLPEGASTDSFGPFEPEVAPMASGHLGPARTLTTPGFNLDEVSW